MLLKLYKPDCNVNLADQNGNQDPSRNEMQSNKNINNRMNNESDTQSNDMHNDLTKTMNPKDKKRTKFNFSGKFCFTTRVKIIHLISKLRQMKVGVIVYVI